MNDMTGSAERKTKLGSPVGESTDPADVLIVRPVEKRNPHLFDYFTLVAKYRATLFLFFLLGGVLFVAATYFMSQTYTAQISILPPEKAGMSNMLSFLTGSGGAMDLLKTSENPALELYRNVLDSREISEELSHDSRIHAFFHSFDTAELAIVDHIHAAITSEPIRTGGLFTVSVDLETHPRPSQAEIDSTKQLVAYFGNTVVATLDHFNRFRLMNSAKSTRIFVEKEYQTRMTQLDTLYRDMQQFQEEHKTIALPEQVTATVGAAAKLGAEVQQLEMQVAVEERDLSPNSSRVQLLRSELDEAKKALSKYDAGGVGDYVVALNSVPALSRKLAQLTREVKLSEQINAYLRQQVEQERIAEQRDLPSFTVLDHAVVPLKKTSPKRSIMGIIGAMFGIFCGFVYVGARNYLDKVKAEPVEHRRILNLMHALRYGRKAKFIPLAGDAPLASKEALEASNDFSRLAPEMPQPSKR